VGDSCSLDALVVFSFRINLEATCHKIRNVNFSVKQTEASAMFMFYINRLLVLSSDGGYGHVYALLTSCYKF
jgi:hypothetical protein